MKQIELRSEKTFKLFKFNKEINFRINSRQI
jgi:hypothetical protein